ncbi:FUSC family protein [Streptomyces incarnatus]|uniref:FUSC family protein n=1 Tax=Streptomyces incarnatus TaxID=665007 RepID=UPI000B266B95|nr:FUSC family protein [Streptomyces incarnatus]
MLAAGAPAPEGQSPSVLRHFEQVFATFDEVYPNWRSTGGVGTRDDQNLLPDRAARRLVLQDRRLSVHLFEPVLAAAEELGLLRRLPADRIQLTPDGLKYRDILSWMFFSKNVIDLDRAYYERLHQQNRRAQKHMGGEPIRISSLKTVGP